MNQNAPLAAVLSFLVAIAGVSSAIAEQNRQQNSPPPPRRAAPQVQQPRIQPGARPGQFVNPGEQIRPGFAQPFRQGGYAQSFRQGGYAQPFHPGGTVARQWAGAGPAGRPRSGFRGINRAHRGPSQYAAWRGGTWNHGWHNGRYGWWWAVDGGWYYYDAPVYPYPEIVSADAVFEPVAAMGAPMSGQMGASPMMQYWYFCDMAGAYYPYVQNCPTAWRSVPAIPQ
jgi:hypothetical protein